MSQLEFDVNLVEREGRRLQTDLNRVQALHTPTLNPVDSSACTTSGGLGSQRPPPVDVIENPPPPLLSKNVTPLLPTTPAAEFRKSANILPASPPAARQPTKERKSVRFSDSETESGQPAAVGGSGVAGVRLRPPKSILKETDGGDCSSDTGLSSLSVSSEEGTYSLTTLV